MFNTRKCWFRRVITSSTMRMRMRFNGEIPNVDQWNVLFMSKHLEKVKWRLCVAIYFYEKKNAYTILSTLVESKTFCILFLLSWLVNSRVERENRSQRRRRFTIFWWINVNVTPPFKCHQFEFSLCNAINSAAKANRNKQNNNKVGVKYSLQRDFLRDPNAIECVWVSQAQ